MSHIKRSSKKGHVTILCSRFQIRCQRISLHGKLLALLHQKLDLPNEKMENWSSLVVTAIITLFLCSVDLAANLNMLNLLIFTRWVALCWRNFHCLCLSVLMMVLLHDTIPITRNKNKNTCEGSWLKHIYTGMLEHREWGYLLSMSHDYREEKQTRHWNSNLITASAYLVLHTNRGR